MPATDGFFRRLNKVHVIFAFSSVLLLLTTVWMLHDDHNDEWRVWQQKWDRLEAARLASVENLQYDTLALGQQEKSEAYDRAKERKDANDEDQKKLDRELKALKDTVAAGLREVKPLRTFRDVARANYDLAIRDDDGSPASATKIAARLAAFVETRREVDVAERILRAAEDAVAKKQDEIIVLQGQLDEDLKELDSLASALDLSQKARQDIAPDSWFRSFKRWLMEQPIVDGFNSHHKVRQDWLPEQRITLGMAKTARFDRCRTCHLGIDRVLAGNVPEFPHGDIDVQADPRTWIAAAKFPHPFSTHPRPDVYVTASSPHSLVEFGCTSCHEGQGSATSFHHAQHSPNHPGEYQEWYEGYGYHPNHFWEYPMPARRLRESTCLKCHHSVGELGINPEFGPTAAKLYRGWKLVQQFGCFGCHEITGFDGAKPIGPDLRLEPRTPEEKARLEADPNQVPGKMRKVGPSLFHISQKTTSAWLDAWITEPRKFRPNTRMPHFFGLSNQGDETGKRYRPVEIAAVTHYLVTQSRKKNEEIEFDRPAADYRPDATRGRTTFSERGCLACHEHKAVVGPNDDRLHTFGPDLSRIHEKLDHDGAFLWLYNWIRNPQKHHPRTKMPDLFLDPFLEKQRAGPDKPIDPAADIAAFLLAQKVTETFDDVDTKVADFTGPLKELVKLYAGKVLGPRTAEEMIDNGTGYPVKDKKKITGDEIELFGPQVTHDMMLAYVGRRTISRYGCYGCHEIPGFEEARPIGTKLEAWGRKDRTKLALEHIEEYLHHHGEADGTSTRMRVEAEMRDAKAHSLGQKIVFTDKEDEQKKTRGAYFYRSLLHHGREGFLWQKLRDPRSYDHKKIETKGYDERLRMPQFIFDPRGAEENEEAIEAIATFVLGLIAEPPPIKYVYQPEPRARDRIEGERLLAKYNCVGCHMVELPAVRFQVALADVPTGDLLPAEHAFGKDLLLKLRPPRPVPLKVDKDGMVEFTFHGFAANRFDRNDPDLAADEREDSFTLWEPLELTWRDSPQGGGKPVTNTRTLLPTEKFLILEADLVSETPARGGRFAEWLIEDLLKRSSDPNRQLAMQASPPPLDSEGLKVQTPWLYRFLKNPDRIRHTTVLRMPKFNLDDEEARALANYFPAVAGADYPYQSVAERQPGYLDTLGGDSYLSETWRLINQPFCIKCHSLGGRQVKVIDPKTDIRGPNLDVVAERLRPDWVHVWLFRPSWITPYTSMPPPFAKNKPRKDGELFGGDPQKQTTAIRDALVNYHRLMEREGKYTPPEPPKPAAAAGEETQP